MKRLRLILVLLGLATVAGLVLFLVTWDIPPPTTRIEKVIPNERLPR